MSVYISKDDPDCVKQCMTIETEGTRQRGRQT